MQFKEQEDKDFNYFVSNISSKDCFYLGQSAYSQQTDLEDDYLKANMFYINSCCFFIHSLKILL